MIVKPGCVGTTIKVFKGQYIDLANPDPQDIEMHSIATALARICRYGGHSPKYLSVAEHCYHATRLAMQDGQSDEVLRAVFLHDASEAYMGDLVAPLKQIIGEEYGDLERKMEHAISERFGVNIHKHYDAYKAYDLMMLKAEKLALWGDDGIAWSRLESVPVREVGFRWWTESNARRHFLHMAHTLGLISREELSVPQ